MHRNKTINTFQSKKIMNLQPSFFSNFLDLQEALLNLYSAVKKSCQHYSLLSKNKTKQGLPQDRESSVWKKWLKINALLSSNYKIPLSISPKR